MFVFTELVKILFYGMYFPLRSIHQVSETTQLYKALALHGTYAFIHVIRHKVKLLRNTNILVKRNGDLKCYAVRLLFVIYYHFKQSITILTL